MRLPNLLNTPPFPFQLPEPLRRARYKWAAVALAGLILIGHFRDPTNAGEPMTGAPSETRSGAAAQPTRAADPAFAPEMGTPASSVAEAVTIYYTAAISRIEMERFQTQRLLDVPGTPESDRVILEGKVELLSRQLADLHSARTELLSERPTP